MKILRELLPLAVPEAEINSIQTISEEVSPLDLTISELQKRAEWFFYRYLDTNFSFDLKK